MAHAVAKSWKEVHFFWGGLCTEREALTTDLEKLGIAKTLTTGALTVGSSAVDYAFGLSSPSTGYLSGPTATMAASLNLLFFDGIETIAIGGINLGEALTSQSLVVVSSVAENINALFNSSGEDSAEAGFSMMAFVKLVNRELELEEEHGVREKLGIIRVASALAGWAAIQSMTVEWNDERILDSLEPVDLEQWKDEKEKRPEDLDLEPESEPDLEIKVTEHENVEGSNAEIISAEVGHASGRGTPSQRKSYFTDRTYLRRMSKIVLGAYGGPGMIAFGMPRPPNLWNKQSGTPSSPTGTPPPASSGTDAEKQDLLLSHSVVQSESTTPVEPGRGQRLSTWWDTVRGRNDQLIFEHYAKLGEGSKVGVKTGDEKEKKEMEQEASVFAGQDPTLPKFWVLTDHNRKEVVLALRGTMSFNELAIDLACDPWDFTLPGHEEGEVGETYQVHSGFHRIAKAMGDKGKPVQMAVASALRKNKGYSLCIAGHSLGAGVGALLALMWADSTTSLTLAVSGMPPDRLVHAYCLACPCIVSEPLSHLSANLVTSLIHSYDFVSRLSLGSIRDLKRVSECLAHAATNKEEKCENVVRRAMKYKAGFGEPGARKAEKEWFLSLRKTLEGQFLSAELYPAGTVYHVFEKEDFMDESLEKRFPQEAIEMDDDVDEGTEPKDGGNVRLFRVKDLQGDFGQIVFSSKMLSYDQVVTDKL
ncbi:hypothetical protein P7C73_g2466, partial [Tremellales sp. Uapishka_1]